MTQLRNAALTDANILKCDDSQRIVVHKTLSNGFQTLVLQHIVIQVNFTQLVLILQDLPDFLGALRRDLIVLKIKTEQCVILFQSSGQGNDTAIPDSVVLKTNFLKGIHHLHAFSDGFSTFFSDAVGITIQLRETVIGGQLGGQFDGTFGANVVVVDVEHPQILLVLQALGEAFGTSG